MTSDELAALVLLGVAGPSVRDTVREEVAPHLVPAMREAGIDTRRRIAHFMAQLAHESARFRTLTEFASGLAYEGRADLGNVNTGDGERYKGRGLIQLTGRANYRRFGQRIGVDLENHPERAAEGEIACRVACAYWTAHNLNELADRDQLTAITQRINGGLNGFADRADLLAGYKKALAVMPLQDKGDLAPCSTLKRGSQGAAVVKLQKALVKVGGDVRPDGVFGPRTEAAVKRFQSAYDLKADGIVGPNTWAALSRKPNGRAV